MATVHIIAALINVHAFSAVVRLTLVARLAAAIVPPGHIYAQRIVVASMQSGRALVQVLFTGCANEAHAARADVWGDAFTPIQTSVLAYSCRKRIGTN